MTTDLTACVITTGEPSTAECLRRVALQDHPHQLLVVGNVHPNHAATQAMVDRCTTPLLVQVDADMLLHTNALSRLVEALEEAGEDVAQWCGYLWGDVERAPIGSIKVFRTEEVRRVPFRNVLMPDCDQAIRLQDLGRRVVVGPRPTTIDGCFGLHWNAQEPGRVYRRWWRLALKQRRSPMEGMAERIRSFSARTDEDARIALQGYQDGMDAGELGDVDVEVPRWPGWR